MTTSDDLVHNVRKVLHGKKFVVALQREPYVHVKTQKGIELQLAAGGVHSLLDGVLRKTGGLMIAVAGGDADQLVVDDRGCIQVPPNNPSYTLKRIFLKKREIEGFYYGFSNQTIWPLCHNVFVKPVFDPIWWEEYTKVNQKFADAILEEVDGEDAFVWVNDYHLALVPRMIRLANPSLHIGVFWHIPWPTYEIFRICPWRKQLMDGLLGADFIGFHRGYHLDNFIDCTRQDLGVIVDSEPKTITYHDRTTKVLNLPAGIDYREIRDVLEKDRLTSHTRIRKDFKITYEKLIIGVDRIDYTKGIPERIKILDRFFEKYPEHQGKVTYLSIGAPSRLHIVTYRQLRQQIFDLVEKINWKYRSDGWQPVYFIDKTIPREAIFSYYRAADVCLVTALDDGMNLVAKEFQICAENDRGVLVLSKFTGAAKDLRSAMLINPYDIEGSADAINAALTMTIGEKMKRNIEMKAILSEHNIYQWTQAFIQNTLA